jgi:sec-independent protein translocase protein TatC
VIFLIAYGLVFELPIIMAGLTNLGVVQAEFWKENWRYAFVGMVIFGAIVTPDGSGITQLIVAFPMMLLYVIGYFIAKRMQKVKKGEGYSPI